MRVRPDRSLSVMCGLTVLLFSWWAFPAAWPGSSGQKYSAVGGHSEYVRQRVEHLKRLRNNLQVTDPEVRAREIAAIDRQLAEIGFEIPEELGDELQVERFEDPTEPTGADQNPKRMDR